MIQNYDEFIKELKNGAGTPLSDLRNPENQVKSYGRRLPMFKKEKNGRVRLLPLKLVIIPFNPFTVEEDDKYNKKRLFSPARSAHTVMSLLKQYYSENEDLKAKFLEKAGYEKEWDLTNPDEITKTDLEVFGEYLKPFIYSYPVMHINDSVVTGNPRGADYLVSLKRNEVGDLLDEWVNADGETVKLAKYTRTASELAALFSSVANNKFKAWLATKEGQAAASNQKLIDTKKMSFNSESPITDDRPKNELICLAIPCTPGEQIQLDEKELLKLEPSAFSKYLVRVNYTKNIRLKIEAFSKDLKNRDVYPSFYELDVIIPDIEDATDRGADTQFDKAEYKIQDLENAEAKKVIYDGVTHAVDSIKDLDAVFKASVYARPLEEDVVEALTARIAETVDIKTLNLTEAQVNRFGELIGDVWASAASDLLVKAQTGALPQGEDVEKQIKEERASITNIMTELEEEEEEEVTELNGLV